MPVNRDACGVNCLMRLYRAVVLASLFAGLAAQSPLLAEKLEFDPATMMRSSEVRPGMRGTGKSVFSGVKIEEFGFEVIGRLEKAILGRDMILAQITSGPPLERNAGVIGGMSGSPCYVRGKLLGALAYGWFWQKEARFGITPIEDMLEATWGLEPEVAAAEADGRWTASEPLNIAGRQITGAVIEPAYSRRAFADFHTIVLKPVSPPITCSGMGPQALELMRSTLEPRGATVLAGPGTKTKPVAVELEPGSAVGVRLMDGDFDAAGVGTLTYRKGDQILAFGHPFIQLGRTKIPMCTGWVHDVMPKIDRSSKVGSGMVDVGTMFSDTPWAIAGRLGKVPDTIPASFHIIDRSRKLTKDFHVQVCDQPMITSMLLASAMMGAVEATFNTGYEGTATLHYKIVGQRGDSIERTNTFYFQQSAVYALMSELAFPMYLLEENRFRPQNIASLEVTAEFNEQDDTAFIERVYAEENVAEAGKALHLHVVLRPDNAEPTERVVTLNIPIDTPKGILRIVVAGGEAAWTLRSRLRLMMPTWNDLDSFIEFFEKLEQNTELVTIGALPSAGVIVGETRMFRLPGSFEAFITASPRTDLQGGKAELSHSEQCPWVVYGSQYMAIATVDRKGAKSAKGKTPSPEFDPDTDVPPPSPMSEAGGQGAWLPGAVAPLTMCWAADAFPQPLASKLRQAAPSPLQPPPPEPPDLTPTPSPEDIAEMLKKETEKPNDQGKEEETDKDQEEEKTKDKVTARQPSAWTQTSAKDFLEGELEGVAVRSDGVVTLTPYVERINSPGVFYVLSAAADPSGAVYVGTGSEGHIYKIADSHKATLFCDLDSFAVTGLMGDGEGGLLAATAPGGKVYRVSADGTAEVYCELPVDYLWAIGKTAQGKVVVCTGSEGKLYELQGAGKYTEVCKLAQAHILCLAADAKYTYLGTASQGVVYRLSADGRYTALFDAKDDDITAITVPKAAQQAGGTIYVATASSKSGGVYEVSADGAVLPLYEDKTTPVYALACMDGALYAGTGDEGKLLCIIDKDHHSVAYDSDNAYFTCLQPINGRELYVGTANQGGLLHVDTARATEGWLESSVLDAKRIAQWGQLQWRVDTTGEAWARIATRSGSNSDPTDKSWSDWSRPLENGQAGSVQSPPGRYLQYRLELARAKAEDTVAVSRVAIAYLPANQAPEVEIKKPSEGAMVSGECSISWDATDPDSDTLMTRIYYRQLGKTDWQLVTEEPEKESYEWDTGDLESGRYQLRIVTDDSASNPGQALSDTATVELLTIDNDEPQVWVDTIEARGNKLFISGVAADDLTNLVEVCYKADGRWYAARAVDGLYDSRHETFDLQIPLPKQKAEVEVRARDAADNECSIKVIWPDSRKVAPLG